MKDHGEPEVGGFWRENERVGIRCGSHFVVLFISIRLRPGLYTIMVFSLRH